MGPTLTLEPLPDSEYPFETAHIKLEQQNQVYVVGFRRNPLLVASSVNGSSPESGIGGRRSGLDGRGVGIAEGMGTVEDVGFSSELVDDKLCIVPADSFEARRIRDLYAAIWLAPGYKVMLMAAEGSKVYYQRAIPGNVKWERIKHGHGVDLADPLMTVLDDAIHIRFDTNPESRAPNDLLRKVLKFLRRSCPPSPPPPPTSRKRPNANASANGNANANLALGTSHSLVRHVHTEIDGTETHPPLNAHQIAARVSVTWDERTSEGWKRLPSRGDLRLESVQARKALGLSPGDEDDEDGDGDESYRIDKTDIDLDMDNKDHPERESESYEDEFSPSPEASSSSDSESEDGHNRGRTTTRESESESVRESLPVRPVRERSRSETTVKINNSKPSSSSPSSFFSKLSLPQKDSKDTKDAKKAKAKSKAKKRKSKSRSRSRSRSRSKSKSRDQSRDRIRSTSTGTSSAGSTTTSPSRS